MVVQYNTFDRRFEGILEQGRHATNVGVKFYDFIRTVQTLPLSEINCLSRDKVSINLNVLVRFRLKRDELIPVIMTQFGYADLHMEFVSFLASSAIHASCTLFDVNDYFTSRSLVDNTMYLAVRDLIDNEHYAVNIELVQVSNIGLPESLVNLMTGKE